MACAVAGLQATGFRGCNVTVPHKQEALAACHELSPAAQAAGAVNTLVFGRSRILGHNTDGEGFLRSLLAAGVQPDAGPALLLGAGGATRAIAAALRDAGVPLLLAARRNEAAIALAAEFGQLPVVAWREAPAALAGCALLVNTTSGGMQGHQLDFGLDAAPGNLAVADIVYAPRRTPLLMEAEARGLRTVEGIGMLLHQAALGFDAWFGVEPLVDDATIAHVLSCASLA